MAATTACRGKTTGRLDPLTPRQGSSKTRDTRLAAPARASGPGREPEARRSGLTSLDIQAEALARLSRKGYRWTGLHPEKARLR